MKKLAVFLAPVLLVLSFATINLSAPQAAFAAPKDEICEGIGEASGEGCGDGEELTNVVHNIINIFSIIVGIVAVIMIMVAGFKYITAAGDSTALTSARHTLTYALVGLGIVGFSQTIVKFVLDKI